MVDSTDLSHFAVPGRRGRAATIVNESGLYTLIMRSRKPEAKAFQRWVTSEVLPAIRKNGGYMTPEVAVQACRLAVGPSDTDAPESLTESTAFAVAGTRS